MQANLVPIGEHRASDGHSTIAQFFVNIQILATHNREQVVVLFGMLFTLIIWVVSALSLLVAVLFYLTFLWHHIPNKDRGLFNYCRRKIDSRLQKIVGVKVNKALAKVNTDRSGREANAIKKKKLPAQLVRQPTLPILDTKPDDKFEDIPSFSRQTTQSTLPPYLPRKASPNRDHLSKIPISDVFPLPRRPLPPSRSTTQSSAFSNASHASNTPLMVDVAETDHGPPIPTYAADLLSRMDVGHKANRPMGRSFTASSRFAQRSHPPAREPSPMLDRRILGSVQMGTPNRQNTGVSGFEFSDTRARSPILLHAFDPKEQISSNNDYRKHTSGSQGSHWTAAQEFEMRSQRPVELPANDKYVAFDPNLHGSRSGTSRPNFVRRPAPPRNFTMPTKPYQALQSIHQQQQLTPPQRSGTAPVPRTLHYNGIPPASYSSTDDNNALPGVRLPLRAATTGPNDRWDGWRRPS